MRPILLPLVAVLALAGCKNNEDPAAAPAATPAAASAPTVAVLPDTSAATPACGWNAQLAEVPNWASLIKPDDPSFGPADAKVTVVEFFEPNCQFCASFAPTIARAQQLHPDVRFVYKPVVFWPFSAVQAQALYAAQAAGKFEPFMLAQFRQHNEQGGLTDTQVKGVLAEAGLNADSIMAQVNAGTYRMKMMSNRTDFGATGSNSVPLVLINGKPMADERSTGCLAKLIQEQAG